MAGASVVVTGASSGIGAATATALARRGARVGLLARTAPALQRVADQIAAAGGEARPYVADLTDVVAVERVAGRVTSELGPPKVLVHCAGAGRWLFVDETPPGEAEQMMAVPYFAAFNVTRAFLPELLQRRGGVIVTVNSPAAFVPWPGATGYIAARWALRGLTESLRSDLRSTGVRVLGVTLGKVQSAYFEHNPGSEERIPRIGRLLPTLTPDEAGEAIAVAVERRGGHIFRPRALRLFVLSQLILPGATRWLVGATGWQRPRDP